ncbi:ABC transporter ATP-binding protein [Candidatus Saccharibacteria bacterium]|jgi:ABC-type nitrate/sulfonate/bicarbonate transport system ATPase subunit|nr:ABC transporter ATP-binding protein [Candidatus Saccharibacteria bacterium]
MSISKSITFENLSKDYAELKVLSSAKGTIQSGSFTSLIGPNGCGKSTLLKILSGITKQTWGTFTIPDSVAYVPQKNSLMPWLSVKQNLDFADKINNTITPNLSKKALSLLERFELNEFIDYFPSQLSGGMQQKLSIINAILRSPDLLLLDEPFSSLDSITRRNLQKWLLEVWREEKITILCVTHDIREAIFLSDTILAMSARPGSIIAEFQVKPGKNKTNLKDNIDIEDKLEKILLS